MAFTLNNFARLGTANSNAPAVFTYRTNDAEAVVEGAGYFNAMSDVLNVGDMIIIHLDADGTDTLEQTWVTANASGVVTVQGLGTFAAS